MCSFSDPEHYLRTHTRLCVGNGSDDGVKASSEGRQLSCRTKTKTRFATFESMVIDSRTSAQVSLSRRHGYKELSSIGWLAKTAEDGQRSAHSKLVEDERMIRGKVQDRYQT
jgi:hypothetical protein